MTTMMGWTLAYAKRQGVRATTRVNYLGSARSLSKWISPDGWDTVHCQKAADGLNDFLDSLIGTRAPRTVLAHRRNLGVILRAAAAEGFCSLGKIRKVKVPQHLPRGFSSEELSALIANANARQLAAIMVSYDTGFRRFDVFRARWSTVVSMDGRAIVKHVVSKSGAVEVRSLSDKTLAACRVAQEAARADGDFTWRRQQHGKTVESRHVTVDDQKPFLVPWPWGWQSWKREWHALGRRANVDTKSRGLQAIRRTSASRVWKTHGAYAAARHLGHADSTGVSVASVFYRVPEIVGEIPVSPPPID